MAKKRRKHRIFKKQRVSRRSGSLRFYVLNYDVCFSRSAQKAGNICPSESRKAWAGNEQNV
jgi:hypothetical protein